VLCTRYRAAFFPFLAFYDYGIAFPTLSQRFLFLLLILVSAPEGFLNVCAGLYNGDGCLP